MMTPSLRATWRLLRRLIALGVIGFWLRGESLLDRARLPSVSGGGLATG